MLPDVVVSIQSAAAPRGLDISFPTRQQFTTGVTQRGSSLNPVACFTFADWQSYLGARTTAGAAASDWAEDFFNEGGKVLYWSRVFGSGATVASVNLLDGSAGVSLVISAGCKGDPDPGTWANGAAGGLSVAVTQPAEGGFQLQVYLNAVLVETSPIFATQADAVGWGSGVNKALFSRYIAVALGAGSLIPAVVGATSLTGGTDGSAVGNSDWQAALDRIPKELGSGQVAAVGAVTSALQLQVIAHAVANRRFPLIAAPDTSNDSTIIAAAASLYAAPTNGRRWAQMVTPWDIAPGLTAFTTRTIDPTARLAAQYQRVDSLGNPNQAAAGDRQNGVFGRAQWIQDLSQPSFNDTQRLALNNAGVTVSRRMGNGRLVTFGFRTLADQVNDRDWSWAPGNRTVMYVAARSAITGARHFGDQLDGFGTSLADFKADLSRPLKDLFNKGALFPDATGAPSTAYYVDTGPSVNTVPTLAQGQELATIKLRVSPGAEQIGIAIVKTPITQAL